MSAPNPARSESVAPAPRNYETASVPTEAFHPDELSSKLVVLLDGYLGELQAGRQPDRLKLLAEHPELAEQLEQCLSGIEFIHHASVAKPATDPLGQLDDFRIVREVGRGGMGGCQGDRHRREQMGAIQGGEGQLVPDCRPGRLG